MARGDTDRFQSCGAAAGRRRGAARAGRYPGRDRRRRTRAGAHAEGRACRAHPRNRCAADGRSRGSRAGARHRRVDRAQAVAARDPDARGAAGAGARARAGQCRAATRSSIASPRRRTRSAAPCRNCSCWRSSMSPAMRTPIPRSARGSPRSPARETIHRRITSCCAAPRTRSLRSTPWRRARWRMFTRSFARRRLPPRCRCSGRCARRVRAGASSCSWPIPPRSTPILPLFVRFPMPNSTSSSRPSALRRRPRSAIRRASRCRRIRTPLRRESLPRATPMSSSISSVMTAMTGPAPRAAARADAASRSRRSGAGTRPPLIDRVAADPAALAAMLSADRGAHDFARDCPADIASIARQWDAAVRLHQEGDRDGAIAQYERVLAQQPGFAPALHLVGVARRDAGDLRGRVGVVLGRDRRRSRICRRPRRRDARRFRAGRACRRDHAGRAGHCAQPRQRRRVTRAGAGRARAPRRCARARRHSPTRCASSRPTAKRISITASRCRWRTTSPRPPARISARWRCGPTSSPRISISACCSRSRASMRGPPRRSPRC